MAMYIKDGKNLFTVTTPISSNIPYNAKTGEITIPAGSHWFDRIVYTFSDPIPANTKISITAFVEKGETSQGDLVLYASHANENGGRTIQCEVSVWKSGDQLNGTRVMYSTAVTTDTVTDIRFHFYKTVVTEEIVMKAFVKIGEAATEYEPFNHARRVKVLDKYGVRNEFDINKLVNVNGYSHTDRDFSKTNNYASGSSMKKVKELFPFMVSGETYTFACTRETSVDLYGAGGQVCCLQTNKVLIPSGLGYVQKVVTINADDLNSLFYAYGHADGTVTWKNFMCVKGDYSNKEMPEYRPFTKILNPRIFAKS